MRAAIVVALLGQTPPPTTTTTTTTTTIQAPPTASEQKADELIRALYALRSQVVVTAPEAYREAVEQRALPSQGATPPVPAQTQPEPEPADDPEAEDTGPPWWDALAL